MIQAEIRTWLCKLLDTVFADLVQSRELCDYQSALYAFCRM